MPSPVGITERACRRATAVRFVAAALVCVVLAVVLGGCAGQSATPPPPAVSTPAPTTAAQLSAELCSAAAEYQTAANAIVTLNASQVGPTASKRLCKTWGRPRTTWSCRPEAVRTAGHGAGKGRLVAEGHDRGAQRSR